MFVWWHLIIDVCKPRSLWSPPVWNPVNLLVLCRNFFYCPVMKPSGLHDQPVIGVKKNVISPPCDSYIVQYTPSTFLPSILFVHRSWFLFRSWFLYFVWLWLIAAKDFGTSTTTTKKNPPYPPPFSKTWILSRPPILLWNCWGKKLCKEEEAAFELCAQETVS